MTLFFSFNIVFLRIQPLHQTFNLCFLVFVINFVPLRTQSSVPIFTWEPDYWLDCSLPLWTLLFLHQVTSISSLCLLFSTQLCVSLCVFHSLDRSEMFPELYREEKREEGDRGGQEDKGGNQKERDRSNR